MLGTQAPRRAARPQHGGRRAIRRRRRSPLRPLIVLPAVLAVLLVLLVVGVLACGWVSQDDRASTADGRGGAPTTSGPSTQISATLLPHAAQTGAQPASADLAAGVVQVQAATMKPGAAVTLQIRRDKTWIDTQTLQLGPDGRASFETGVLRDLERPGRRQRLLRVAAIADRHVHSDPLHPDSWKLAGYALDGTKWGYRQLGLLDPGRT